MALKGSSSEQDQIIADINMTPLIDIMLVLLIIFMVTSSVGLESGLDIDLPKTEGKTSPKDGRAVLISMDKDGRISIQGTETTLEKLEDAVKTALKQENTEMVVFEGDQNSRLSHAIKIMDLAKAAGAKHFAIAAESVKMSQ